jgi:hypothetical protein
MKHQIALDGTGIDGFEALERIRRQWLSTVLHECLQRGVTSA